MRRFFSYQLPLYISACALMSFAYAPQQAHAAEFTELVDAADDFDDLDESTFDPFDFHLEPSFTFQYTNAQISREAPCVPALTGSESDLVRNNPRLVVSEARCSEPRFVYNKEMLFTGTRSQVDLKLRAGLYKDLELHVNVPYVFVNSRKLTYDNTDPDSTRHVDETNSSVDPRTDCQPGDSGRCITSEANDIFDPTDTDAQKVDKLDRFNAYRYYELGAEKEYLRSGFSEPSVGLHWGIFNDERDDTKATLNLGLDYVMPIVPIARANNDNIGRGVHELQFNISSSKRFDWVEPYFGLQYFLPFAASDSPIRKIDPNNNGQVFTRPPMKGEITIGSEFIPYENAKTGARYGIDLRFVFGYTSEGRDYHPMFDHMAKSECNGKTLADVLPRYQGGALQNPDDVACAWIVRQPSNADIKPVYDLGQVVTDGEQDRYTFSTDGIMTVEAHGIFRGLLGFYLQPSKNFQLKGSVSLEHQQEHFLTNARTGKDISDSSETTPDETVDLEGPDAKLERNPVYNPSYDSSGERFRVNAMQTWTFMLTTAIQF